jgi:predicted dehydrogenase
MSRIPLRTAIIGMGKMGRIRKIELDRHPGFEVVALCDVDPAVAAMFPSAHFSTDWRAILALELDAVVVCTFNNVAPDIVCLALDRGLHVFCEKPPGRSVADVERIIEHQRRAPGKVVKFGFNHRFHYGVMEARALVESGRYGKPLWARGVYGKAGGLTFENSWRSDKELAGGGILLDQGIHMLDLMLLFLGEFNDVKSMVENCYWKNVPLEDNAFALMRTAEGRVAMVHSSATQWKHKFSLDLFLEDGYICINGILSSTRSYGEESITFARRQFEDEARAMGKPREETIYFDQDDSWRHEIEEFHECILEPGRIPAGSAADALRVMRLIERIYESGQSPDLRTTDSNIRVGHV